MNRTATLTIAILATATVAAPGALAAPKPKPITKSYTATAVVPDPTNVAGTSAYSVCAQTLPGSFHSEPFKVPAAGTLKVEMPGTGYQGDWDLLLVDAKGKELAMSGGLPTLPGAPVDEVMQAKFKKVTEVKIIACNWAGGPTAGVKYTFTFK